MFHSFFLSCQFLWVDSMKRFERVRDIFDATAKLHFRVYFRTKCVELDVDVAVNTSTKYFTEKFLIRCDDVGTEKCCLVKTKFLM